MGNGECRPVNDRLVAAVSICWTARPRPRRRAANYQGAGAAPEPGRDDEVWTF